MYRIIIIDDEPLILAGIASLISWEDYDCTIIGKATNGPAAYEMIRELNPDIVITDIRMPVLSGLELVEKCKADDLNFAFIVLTNLEEFHLVKKALSLGASDYLVKIDLNEEALVTALNRAKEACELLVHKKNQLYGGDMKYSQEGPAKAAFRQLFFQTGKIEEIPQEVTEQYPAPFLIMFSLAPIYVDFDTSGERYDLASVSKQLMDILGGIAGRCFFHHTVLEYRQETFLLTASLKDASKEEAGFQESVRDFCQKMSVALKTYFELSAVYGVSSLKKQVSELPKALSEASTSLEYYYFDSSSRVIFYEGQTLHFSQAKKFNINVFKKDLAAFISQNDSEKLEAIFEEIITLFRDNKPSKEQATSACINVYTYLYSFFETGDDSYEEIFPYTINIADQLNHFNSLEDILEWLHGFCEKLCRLLKDRKSTRSDKLVDMSRAYINDHYTEKLTLTDVAEALNISSGHLSNTFKKLTGITLSDYIAQVKIEHAKELIDTHQYLMYEISDRLGFDNPYYFSKVFKKVTGISPREYESRAVHTLTDERN
ncbi:MAG: response regulator [Lacrimispora sp.]|uniref:response regulator n=1 Tax=Lacrimispora sp. TaxID=2719234 RepID=UPI0039E5AD27